MKITISGVCKKLFDISSVSQWLLLSHYTRSAERNKILPFIYIHLKQNKSLSPRHSLAEALCSAGNTRSSIRDTRDSNDCCSALFLSTVLKIHQYGWLWNRCTLIRWHFWRGNTWVSETCDTHARTADDHKVLAGELYIYSTSRLGGAAKSFAAILTKQESFFFFDVASKMCVWTCRPACSQANLHEILLMPHFWIALLKAEVMLQKIQNYKINALVGWKKVTFRNYLLFFSAQKLFLKTKIFISC